jgi:2-polyprenyl-3-methyl-5-hydroxy-6-metoxy-1,4-benzoquinol methylase
MSLGCFSRKVLGRQLFKVAAHHYRAFFVDLKKVARTTAEYVPPNAHVIDVGGGDGEPLNYLLRLRPDIKVTMIDLREGIGLLIDEQLSPRITIMPRTSVRQYAVRKSTPAQCVLVSDVIHHVPVHERATFLADLSDLVNRTQARIIIKEIEPGNVRARLSEFADRYISGDKKVSLISKSALKTLAESVFGQVTIEETSLFLEDNPNYSLVFSFLIGNEQAKRIGESSACKSSVHAMSAGNFHDSSPKLR